MESDDEPIDFRTPDDLADLYGGYWSKGHPDFPIEDWRLEVANNDTRCGYWDWVFNQYIEV